MGLETEDVAGGSPFWVAFWAGLAAPASLYAAPAAYDLYTVPLSPAQSFGIVGGYMSEAAATGLDEQSADQRAA